MVDVLELSLAELSGKLKTRELSPVEVTEACLARIDATEGRLHAYVRVLRESALAAARDAECDIADGRWKGPLHGVPVAVKDLYNLAGTATTASSKVRTHWVRDTDSAVVAKLKAAGAVIVGKTQTHEFAYGGVTPTTRNPWDVTRSPGGSSGGSAATVAAGGAFMATGTDTAGSIRIPAAMCGVVGLKPTYGRVSRFGVTPLSWGLDHAGVLTRTVADAAVCLQAIAGHDPRDPGSLPEAVPDFSAGLALGVAGMRVGVPKNYFREHVDAEVAAAVRAASDQLESLGAQPVEVDIPMPERMLPMEFAILMPEASAYHRRMLATTPELYTAEVRTLLEAGQQIAAVDYIQAQRVRELLRQAFRKVYEQVDVIVAPTVATPAIRPDAGSITWDDGTVEPAAETLIRLTVPANLTGLPALSLPCGFSIAGLPIGLQIIGRPLEEATVMRLGAAYEHATPWHDRHPAS